MGHEADKPTSHPIEWCTHTSNPITGCFHGCPYCYARRAATRWAHVEKTVYHRLAVSGVNPFTPAINMDSFRDLEQELRRARVSRRVFVGSMSDLGGARRWVRIDGEGPIDVCDTIDRRQVVAMFRRLCNGLGWRVPHVLCFLTKAPDGLAGHWPGAPCRGAWVGVSAKDPEGALWRITTLLRVVTAPVRWLSLEPLGADVPEGRMLEALELSRAHELDWIVIGGQTGPGAPSPNVRTARSVVEWAHTQGVPCFVKANMRRGDTSAVWPTMYPEGGLK